MGVLVLAFYRYCYIYSPVLCSSGGEVVHESKSIEHQGLDQGLYPCTPSSSIFEEKRKKLTAAIYLVTRALTDLILHNNING